MRPLLLAAAALLALTLASPGITLAQGLVSTRPEAVVDAPVVRLGDLFDNAGPGAETVLGNAPAPGRRFVVEAAQLQHIARLHSLPWRPMGADERVVVERPGRPLGQEEVAEALLPELERLGAEPGFELELTGFTPPMLPATAPVRLVVESASFDAETRRFSATLVVLAEGMPTLRQRLSGAAAEMQTALVAQRRLAPGEILRPGDVKPMRLRTERQRPGQLERLEEVLGQQLRRAVAAGQPLTAGDLGGLVATISRGAPVVMSYEAPGLSLTAQGLALEDGAAGAVITVQNLASGTVVAALVTGPQSVRVLGTGPVRPAAPGGFRSNLPRPPAAAAGRAALAWNPVQPR
jgi:flagella basal body P-ring formation protein FlgA